MFQANYLIGHFECQLILAKIYENRLPEQIYNFNNEKLFAQCGQSSSTDFITNDTHTLVPEVTFVIVFNCQRKYKN